MGASVQAASLESVFKHGLIVQSPYNSQSYNRYSYTFNNPTSYIDPTGYGCTTQYFHNYYCEEAGSSNYLGMSTQQTCDGNDLYNRPDYDNGYENFEVPQFTLNDQLNYAAQQSPATGIMSSIEGNAFAGAGCGILAVCLGDSVEDAADIAVAERVVGSSTLLIAGIVAPGPGGKAKVVVKMADSLKIGKGANNPKVKAALEKGQQAHKDRQYPQGFKKKVPLPSGKRMDAYNKDTKEIIELKPNNLRAIRQGEKQVDGYCRECDKAFGPGHRGRVETYE